MVRSKEELTGIFARNLRNRMNEACLKQNELAKKMNVSETAVSLWIRGTLCPRMDKIDEMCRIFGCTRADLLFDPNEKMNTGHSEFYSLFSALKPEQQDVIVQTMKAMIQLNGGK